MNQEEIKKILPHRDNMLLVEEAEKSTMLPRREDTQSRATSSFYRDIFRAILLFRVLFSVNDGTVGLLPACGQG